ncbi:response regulator [bacterium]|nr:response regulator [bacterium]
MTMSTPHVPMDILLIEDREDEISMVEDAIAETELNNRMVVAKSLGEAIAYLKQTTVEVASRLSELHKPGLILLDINLHEAQGYDILHEIKTDPSLMTIPVVILTDTLEEKDLAFTISHGVTGYFLKPMDIGQLRKVVKDVEDHWTVLTTAPCAN